MPNSCIRKGTQRQRRKMRNRPKPAFCCSASKPRQCREREWMMTVLRVRERRRISQRWQTNSVRWQRAGCGKRQRVSNKCQQQVSATSVSNRSRWLPSRPRGRDDRLLRRVVGSGSHRSQPRNSQHGAAPRPRRRGRNQVVRCLRVRVHIIGHARNNM